MRAQVTLILASTHECTQIRENLPKERVIYKNHPVRGWLLVVQWCTRIPQPLIKLESQW